MKIKLAIETRRYEYYFYASDYTWYWNFQIWDIKYNECLFKSPISPRMLKNI